MNKRLKSQIIIWICVILLSNILVIDYTPAQTIITMNKGSIFKKGIYYNNDSILDYIHSSKEAQWDKWVEEGYLGKRSQWYYVKFPEYELWDKNVICYEMKHNSLKWLQGKKNFGWNQNKTVEPIEIHYREHRFKIKNNEVEKEKGVLLKNKNNGHQDLKDIVYNGLKGVTVAFKNRIKSKIK